MKLITQKNALISKKIVLEELVTLVKKFVLKDIQELYANLVIYMESFGNIDIVKIYLKKK